MSLLKSPEPEDSDEDDTVPETVELKALPMIAGSGFTLATVEWQGLAWRPRVGQKLSEALSRVFKILIAADIQIY